MLIPPESLKMTRSKKAEESLMVRSREWLMKEERDPRIHVSDLLDPRVGYWQRMEPKELSDKLVTMFLIGKVLHAFVLSAVDGDKGTDLSSDEGSKWSQDLGICYSIDKNLKYPRELKTSRSYYEPKSAKDLMMYIEQLMCYMVAEGKTKGQIWILFLNAKDPKTKRTAPAYRAYTIRVTEAELADYRAQMKATQRKLSQALKKKDHTILPLCRSFKCSEIDCEWWESCQPEGRYGKKRPSKGWPETGTDLQVKYRKPRKAKDG
jgi:hypothetical protein